MKQAVHMHLILCLCLFSMKPVSAVCTILQSSALGNSHEVDHQADSHIIYRLCILCGKHTSCNHTNRFDTCYKHAILKSKHAQLCLTILYHSNNSELVAVLYNICLNCMHKREEYRYWQMHKRCHSARACMHSILTL